MKNNCPYCGKPIVVYQGFQIEKPTPLPEIKEYKPKPLEPTAVDTILEALEPYLPQIIEKLKKSIGVDEEATEATSE